MELTNLTIKHHKAQWRWRISSLLLQASFSLQALSETILPFEKACWAKVARKFGLNASLHDCRCQQCQVETRGGPFQRSFFVTSRTSRYLLLSIKDDEILLSKSDLLVVLQVALQMRAGGDMISGYGLWTNSSWPRVSLGSWAVREWVKSSFGLC